MKEHKVFTRLLSLIVLLSILAGLIPAGALSVQAQEIENRAAKDYSAEISNLALPVISTQTKVDIAALGNNRTGLEGEYLIVNQGSDGKYRVVLPYASDGVLPVKEVTVENDQVKNADHTMVTTLLKSGAYEDYYTIRNHENQTIMGNITDGIVGITYTDNIYYSTVIHFNSNQVLFVRWFDTNGDNTVETHYFSCDGSKVYLRKVDAVKAEDRFSLIRVEFLTRELYELLQTAKSCATGNGDETFDSEAYSAFTAALEEGISAYKTYNKGLSGTDLTNAQTELPQKVEQLHEALYALGLQGKAASLLQQVQALPLGGDWNGQVQLHKESAPYISNMRGLHYIVARGYPDNGTKFWALDGRARSNEDGSIPSIAIKYMQSPTVAIKTDLIPQMAVYLTPRGEDKGYSRYALLTGDHHSELGKKQVLYIDGSETGVTDQGRKVQYIERTSNPKVVDIRHMLQTDGWSAHIMESVGSEYYSLSLDTSSSTYVYRWMKGATDTELYSDSHKMIYLYRLWSTKKLYEIFGQITPFLQTPSAYPEGVYGEFIKCVEESLDMYSKYNKFPGSVEEAPRMEDFFQEIIDRQEDALISYVTLLGSEKEYIDVPVEVLDFRSDYVMMYNTAFLALRHDYRDFAEGSSRRNELLSVGELPGYADPKITVPLTSDGATHCRVGLTEPELVDRRIVYDVQTLTFIANVIHQRKGVKTNLYIMPGQNTVFDAMTKASGFELGSWEQTKKKIVDKNGTVTEKNGDILPWSSVKTAFDLAYYVATNLWRPVSETDVMSDGYLYNMVVPERDTMRLYMDDTGKYYTLDSANSMGYTGRYILNTETAQPNGKSHPHFAPIDGLGFDRNNFLDNNKDSDTSASSGVLSGLYSSGSNYIYTLHAYGSFVYYEDQDPEFTFKGDDDVHFFVNNRIAMDLGGAHLAISKTVKLRDIADELGLVDGEIYPFDMFYAERSPTQANLNFSTNIKIIDTETMTGKGQYLHSHKDGSSAVDSTTAQGSALIDNAMVGIGDTVAYSFDLLNLRDVPIFDLSFEDKTLGTSLSKNNIVLCDPAKTNGALNQIEDMIVYYRSYDLQSDGKYILNDQIPVKTDIADMIRMIKDANILTQSGEKELYRPLPKGSYRVHISSAEELMELLELGTSAKSKISIYGVKRNTVETDRPYENTVSSICYYTRASSNSGSYVDGEKTPITGSASRILQVPDLNSIALPEVERREIVIDYGKAVEIPMADLRSLIYDNSVAKVGDVLGFVTEGHNGYMQKYAPENLLPATEAFSTNNGTYTFDGENITFKLDRMLSEIETIFVVYGLSGCYGRIDGVETEYKYLLQEIRIIPATLMYYETDFAEGIFTTEQVGVSDEGWTEATEGAEAEDPLQDYSLLSGSMTDRVIDTEHIPGNAFFVDFDGKGNAERYSKNPLYNGYDFDSEKQWLTQTNASNSTGESIAANRRIDQSQSVMRVQVWGQPFITENGDNHGYGPHIRTTMDASALTITNPLLLSPTEDSYLQVRFKLENCKLAANEEAMQVIFVFDYLGNDGNHAYDASGAIQTLTDYDVAEGSYITVKIPINQEDGDRYYTANAITGVGIRFKNIVNSTSGQVGNVVIDYIYVGPEMGFTADLLNDDCLYFGFEGAAVNEQRFQKPAYGGDTTYRNYDSADNWSTSHLTTENLRIHNSTIAYQSIFYETRKSNYVVSAPDFNSLTMSFRPKETDYLQIRFRVDNASMIPLETVGRAEFEMNYCYNPKTQDGVLTNSVELELSEVVDKGFMTITIPVNFKKANGEEIRVSDYDLTGVWPSLRGFSETSIDPYVPVQFYIDYLYIGPLEQSCPANKTLYFGFENSAEDQERYKGEAYGGINFDRWDTETPNDVTNWASAYGSSGTQNEINGNMKDFEINHTAGTMTAFLDHEKTYDDNEVYRVDLMPASTYGKYVFTPNIQSAPVPLNFRQDQADLIQVRLRLENCVDGSEEDLFVNDTGWNEAEGDQWDVPRLNVRVNYMTNGEYGVIGTQVYSANIDANRTDYQVLTIPLEDKLSAADLIKCVDLRIWHLKGLTDEQGNDIGKVVIDYIYVGPGKYAPDPVYGYDSSYDNDSLLSNGSSLFVKGNGIRHDPTAEQLQNNTYTSPAKYTEAHFSFTGTGFDLISRTAPEQATFRLGVFTDPDMTQDSCIKAITVNNKGELDLYQIPVVSVQGLDYGTYYVKIGVNDKVNNPGVINGIDMSFLARGNEFYFDAVRIYDPMNTEEDSLEEKEQIALHAYLTDKEAYNYIKEIRNILISEDTFHTLEGTGAGAVYIDVNSSFVQPDGSIDPNKVSTQYIIDSIDTYNKIGPKNEVYLAPGQAVAFRLSVDTVQAIASLDVGAKTIAAGNGAQLAYGIVTKDQNGVFAVTQYDSVFVNSATAQYYAIANDTIETNTDTGTKNVYLVIFNKNTGATNIAGNVLSITDIKVAYAAKPETKLPEDSITDPEIRPSEDSSDGGTSNDGGQSPATPAPTAEGIQSAKRSTETETAPVRFLVDNSTAEAAACFLKRIFETPVDQEPTADSEMKLYHNLELASDISLNYLVPKTMLEGCEEIRLECVIPVYRDNTLTGSKTLSLAPVEKGAYYYFTLEGLTAVQMTDEIHATLYWVNDSMPYCSQTDVYSVAQYAYAQLDKSSVSATLKTLCADLLRYGAKAQTYKNYRTDSFADANMTDAHRTYLSDMDSVTFGNTNKVLNDLENAPISWSGKALNLESKVALKFVFDPVNYKGDLSKLTLKVSYTDIHGTPKAVILEAPELYNPDRMLYAFTLDALLAAELRAVVSAQILAGDTPVSCTLQYSADTYGNNKEGDLLALCKALYAYSDSAKAYFS